MIQRENYYNQSTIWGSAADEYQRQVLADILSLIPSDTTSILDVGCGDGHITNHLPVDVHVVGLDISDEALSHVQRQTCVGDVLNLPFEDGTFDLVMVNDVLEHIPQGDLERALTELARVSSKYIIVTVPHNEQVQSRYTQCDDCGNLYHVHWHQRRFDRKTMEFLFTNCGAVIRELRYSGATTLPPWDPTVELRNKLGYLYNWGQAVCPHCGSTSQRGREADEFERVMSAARHNVWCESGALFKHNNRSELIGLYTVSSSGRAPMNVPPADGQGLLRKLQTEIDFTNALQREETDFSVGDICGKYIVSGELVTCTSQGISVRDGCDSAEVAIRLPIAPKERDSLVIEATLPDADSTIDVFAADGITNYRRHLYELKSTSGLRHEMPVECAWPPDRYGFPIYVRLNGNAVISRMWLQSSVVGLNDEVDWVQIHKGHNVFWEDRDGLLVSWGYLSRVSGYIPKPNFSSESDWITDDIQVLQAFREVITTSLLFTYRTVQYLTGTLEEKEQARSYAEHSYAEAGRQLLTMESRINETLVKVQETDEKLRRAEHYETLWHKNANRVRRKILVLSHMFPHEDYPISGPFVHEQVKALRDYEGCDVRVISCKPYWMNGLNVRRLVAANREYKRILENVEWENVDGVPTLYLPYRVGKPMLMYPLHGISYRHAVMSVISRVWHDFPFDLVHAHTAYLDGTAGLEIAKRYHIPFIITEHTGPFSKLSEVPIVRSFTKRSINLADRVLCVSQALANDVVAATGVPAEKLQVLHNGVSTQEFYPAVRNRERMSPQILFVGFLEPPKDPLLLVEAINILKAKYPNITVTFAGDGGLRESITRRATELGLGQNCNILGMLSRADVAKLMREGCDVVVLPSQAETFGVVLIEAIASGRPVVATKCGGPEDIVVSPDLGELCEHNPNSLADALDRVLSRLDKYDPEKLALHATEYFGYKGLAKRLASLYQEF